MNKGVYIDTEKIDDIILDINRDMQFVNIVSESNRVLNMFNNYMDNMIVEKTMPSLIFTIPQRS